MPFVLRGVVLLAMFVVAFTLMKDVGFTPQKSIGVAKGVRRIASASIEYGWRVPTVKWIMLASPFTAGVGFYAFYALQPYLLDLWGDSEAYGIAGLVAAIVAGAQIVGGLAAPLIRRMFHRRTSALLVTALASAVTLVLIGVFQNFWVVIGLIVVWGLLFAASMPIRQTYLNGLIPSQQRATILSFDSMLGSTGGVVVQPVLGRSARRLGVPGLVRPRRRHLRARPALHPPVPQAERSGRHGRRRCGGAARAGGGRGARRGRLGVSRARTVQRLAHAGERTVRVTRALAQHVRAAVELERDRFDAEFAQPAVEPAQDGRAARAGVVRNLEHGTFAVGNHLHFAMSP